MSELVIGYFDQLRKEYRTTSLPSSFEIGSGIGNVSLKDGKPFVHLHVVATGPDGAAVGGHLMEGTKVYVIEAYVRGVNAGATAGLPRRPHEFAVLGGGPSAWEPPDVLAVLKLQSFLIPSNWDVELARLRVLLADGPDAVGELDPVRFGRTASVSERVSRIPPARSRSRFAKSGVFQIKQDVAQVVAGGLQLGPPAVGHGVAD